MNDDDLQLDLLLFSVGHVCFGVDVEQVSEVNKYDGEQAEDLFWFHEELDFCNTPVVYDLPTIVTIRTDTGPSYRVIIDCIKEIASFSRNEIQLFPRILEPLTLQYGMWGIIPRDGSLIVLLDFHRLFPKRLSNTNPNSPAE